MTTKTCSCGATDFEEGVAIARGREIGLLDRLRPAHVAGKSFYNRDKAENRDRGITAYRCVGCGRLEFYAGPTL